MEMWGSHNTQYACFELTREARTKNELDGVSAKWMMRLPRTSQRSFPYGMGVRLSARSCTNSLKLPASCNHFLLLIGDRGPRPASDWTKADAQRLSKYPQYKSLRRQSSVWPRLRLSLERLQIPRCTNPNCKSNQRVLQGPPPLTPTLTLTDLLDWLTG